jgi:hypothetical protein
MNHKLPLNASKEDIIQHAREIIEDELQYLDIKPYSRNIIGLELRNVDKKCGVESANSLIDEFDLEGVGFNKEVDGCDSEGD